VGLGVGLKIPELAGSVHVKKKRQVEQSLEVGPEEGASGS